jgi:hypothetical protein
MEETAPPLMRALVVAARCLVEGKREDGLVALQEAVEGFSDPEAIFYCARQFARLGESRRALDALTRACDGGYCCYATLNRDPWFDLLRDDPEFQRIVTRLHAVHQSMVAAFVQAGGPAVLGEAAARSPE